MRGRPIAVLIVVACLLLAGCAAVIDGSPSTTVPDGDDPDDSPDRRDPENDVIGWEDGYWHNESITVDQTDGLSDAELEAYVARGMARVEYIRDREFKSAVPVEIISRDEYDPSGGGGSLAYQAWNDQVWEGLWIVGEDTPVAQAFSATRGSSVGGFYSPSDDAITIITDSPGAPTINNGTLIHELTHALQDQYEDLGRSGLSARTQDTQLAADGVIEGEANYVEDRYNQRCEAVWRCVSSPGGGGGGSVPENFNFGLFVTIFFPYSDGPVWVAEEVEREGWSAIAAAYEDPPDSSEQIIHGTDEEPIPLTFEDTSGGSWELFPNQGIDGADTVGEASIFAMFWHQSRTYQAGVVDVSALGERESPYDTYNYESEPSAGWGNDLLVPYRNAAGDGAYVWKTVWDTTEDAREFQQAYIQVLDAHDARFLGNGTYVVDEGPFADAFRVVRNDTRVTIVNGPTVEALAELRPSLAGDGVPTDRATSTTSGVAGPGLGITSALVAGVLTLLVGLGRARRR